MPRARHVGAPLENEDLPGQKTRPRSEADTLRFPLTKKEAAGPAKDLGRASDLVGGQHVWTGREHGR